MKGSKPNEFDFELDRLTNSKIMGLIKEPLDVDFYFTGKEMTAEDQKRVSDYIRKQKMRPPPRQLKNQK